MHVLPGAVDRILQAQQEADKPLAVVLAGHNGSGKSTMWYEQLADRLQVPLINADRMMMSILPNVAEKGARLPAWAAALRDADASWMRVAQNGVQAFVAEAMSSGVPFAMETVFSHWVEHADGTCESKVDLIRQMQDAGYFVVLLFVGLSNSGLSAARVATRIADGGHAVPEEKLQSRFPKTQRAVAVASQVADATLMVDNSRAPDLAFTVCRIQLQDDVVFDRRNDPNPLPKEIASWLEIVAPLAPAA